MDTNQRVLQRQQIVLKFLGYYRGRCDGIWSKRTITAKRDFELSGKFNPGYPNNGMPFNHDGPFPSGIIRDPLNKHCITHIDMPKEFIAKHESELCVCTERFDPEPVENIVDQVKQVPVESTVSVEQEDDIEDPDLDLSDVNASDVNTSDVNASDVKVTDTETPEPRLSMHTHNKFKQGHKK